MQQTSGTSVTTANTVADAEEPGVERTRWNPIKLLVAPGEGGVGPLDFSWTCAGEPLIVGFPCDRERPTGGCGCARSFTGLHSRKGTTLGVVAHRNADLHEMAIESATMFAGGKPSREEVRYAYESLAQTSGFCERLVVGTYVGTALRNRGCQIFVAPCRMYKSFAQPPAK